MTTNRSDRDRRKSRHRRYRNVLAAILITLIVLGGNAIRSHKDLPDVDLADFNGYNLPRHYDRATMKVWRSVLSKQGGCLNRFTYDSKLSPSDPKTVDCDSPEARMREAENLINVVTWSSCPSIDEEWILYGWDRKSHCLRYPVRVGYCYPEFVPTRGGPAVLLYAPSACDESLPLPGVSPAVVPWNLWPYFKPKSSDFSRVVVTGIKPLNSGQPCEAQSVPLQDANQLVCVAPH